MFFDRPDIDYPEAYKICKLFMISENDLFKIRDNISKELYAGLNRDLHFRSTIKCFNSYVQDLPTGRERGRFLALEMWPTNIRIMLVKFGNEKDIYMSSKCMVLPHTVAAGHSDALFNFLAENIAIFVKEKKVEKDNLPMGLAFAFALRKEALDVGILLKWAHGFGAQGVIGKNVSQLLRDALKRYPEVSVNICAIVNYAVGTLLALAWTNPDCKMGLIVGTGTNASFVELLENCELYEGELNNPYMVINSEWGNFGETGQLDFLRTEFDKIVDSNTSNHGQQIYEKCVSTLYMGELVRLIIIRLMDQGVIFKEHNQDYIGIQWKMEMKSLIAIESDPPGVYTKCQEVMDKFRMRNCKEKDLAIVRLITETITRRSAMLIACGVAAVVNKMNYPEAVIGVDGGVYRLHPHYGTVLNRYARILTNPGIKFQIVVSEDSCGVGAAIIAGIVTNRSAN